MNMFKFFRLSFSVSRYSRSYPFFGNLSRVHPSSSGPLVSSRKSDIGPFVSNMPIRSSIIRGHHNIQRNKKVSLKSLLIFIY